MCGIIGYNGKGDAAAILVGGLKRLEYRGYDSAGVGVIGERGSLTVVKTPGKIAALERELEGIELGGHVGIGHTRWATHGEPSMHNAHPHFSADGTVAVVHNGIVENYESLRSMLYQEGCRFSSDTDTEVLPNLIARELTRTSSLAEAVAAALRYVEGAYAIAVVSSVYTHQVVAACNSSPLVVGIGEGELFVASDALALAGNVSAIAHVHDGELVVLERNGRYSFKGLSLADAQARFEKPAVSAEETSKGGYTHYMHKEIHEQPQAMRNVLAGRLREGHAVIFGGFTPDIEARLRDTRRIILLGCGTSLFAAESAQALIERLGGVICQTEQAAEFFYRTPELSSADTVIGISQSGETADTLHAMALAKEHHALVLGVTNRVGSALAKRVRAGVYLHAGPEIAVASTKAFTAQAAALALVAVRLAQLRDRPVQEQLQEQLLKLPTLLADALRREGEMQALAQRCANAKRLIVIGRGSGVALAHEAALKVREVAYMDAHGLSAAELKHGTLALVEPGVPVLALMPTGVLRAKMHSNLQEVKARGGEVLLIEPPDVCDELVPIVLAPLVHLFAYHLGVARGVDVDQPRNLAKAVTVE